MSTQERKIYDQRAKSLKNDITIEPNSKYRRRDNQRQFIDVSISTVIPELFVHFVLSNGLSKWLLLSNGSVSTIRNTKMFVCLFVCPL